MTAHSVYCRRSDERDIFICKYRGESSASSLQVESVLLTDESDALGSSSSESVCSATTMEASWCYATAIYLSWSGQMADSLFFSHSLDVLRWNAL